MKLIKQITQDILQNKKVVVYIEPIPKYQLTVDENEKNVISKDTGGMVRLYASGTKEIVTYEIKDIFEYKPESTEPEMFISYDIKYPTSAVYSVLNKHVKYKKFEVDQSRILLGTVPNIATITYASGTEDIVIQKFGIVYKDKYYQNKLDAILYEIKNDVYYDNIKTCTTLESVSNERTKDNIKFTARGNVICEPKPYRGGTADAYIDGVVYDSEGYDIDYYNKTIIPYKTTSVIDSTHTGPVQNLFYLNNGDGGYTEKSFSEKVKSVVTYDYLYGGEDPLPKKVEVETELYGKNYINLNNFLILGHVGTDLQFKEVIIANKLESNYMTSYIERDVNNYEEVVIDNVRFFRQTSVVKSRQEDCLIADLLDKKVLYQCVKGAGVWNGLSNMIALLETKYREPIFKNTPLIDLTKDSMYNQLSMSYFTKSGPDMIPIYDILAGRGGSLHILNGYLKIYVGKERFERTIVKTYPLGKSNSHNTIYSEKIGEIQQDFDSKMFIGGPSPLKTYTVPTYQYESIESTDNLKGTDKFANVGYENAVYYSKEDVDIVIDNYTKMNDYLNRVNITFRGIAFIDELENFMGDREFIIDKISWDVGANITTFVCRAVILT